MLVIVGKQPQATNQNPLSVFVVASQLETAAS